VLRCTVSDLRERRTSRSDLAAGGIRVTSRTERRPARARHRRMGRHIPSVTSSSSGRAGFTGTSSAFGYLHALLDHNVDDHVIERVVSSAYPITGPNDRIRYIAEVRVQGYGVMSVGGGRREAVQPCTRPRTPRWAVCRTDDRHRALVARIDRCDGCGWCRTAF
jgi:hypothetical protein